MTSEELTSHIFKKEGKVSSTAARKFLNNLHYEGLEKQALHCPNPEVKINLYEAIASDAQNDNTRNLNALNEEMGLTEEFYAKNAQSVDTFLSDTDRLETAWKVRYGEQTSYSKVMKKIVNNDPSITNKETVALLEFINEEYSQHCGIEVSKLNFFEGDPNSLGYQREGEIGINLSSPLFKEDPKQLLNTLFHEVDHGKQCKMGQDYRDGMIERGHPDYMTARVFAANLKSNNGYIQPQNLLGHQAYKTQPAEVAARYSGERAVHIATNIHGNTPTRPTVKQYRQVPNRQYNA